MRICLEAFGLVPAALTFDTGEEAIKIANATPYGLAGAIWTRDVDRAHRVAPGVRAGTSRINGYATISVMAPFSGFGRSSGREALLAYTQPKSVWAETAAAPVMPFGDAGREWGRHPHRNMLRPPETETT